MFETSEIHAEHKDLIHDVSYDYYGERMATCSSDHHVKVFDQNKEGKWIMTASWKAHSGSVWKVTWTHPEFGQVLATSSFDRTAAVWEEVVGETPCPGERGTRHWVRRTNLVDSRTSVTDVKFGPRIHGLQLATCSADGIVRIYEAPDVMNLSQWTLQHEIQCKLPCSCLSWNPALTKRQPIMIAVGSDDSNVANGGKVFIYEYSENSRRWTKTETLATITDPVHDLAFAPNLGRSFNVLGVASKDVRIIYLTPVNDNSGIQSDLTKFDIETVSQFDDHNSTVWRVSWNVTGTLLASSGDDGNVRMFRMNCIKSWKSVAVLKGDGSQIACGETAPSTSSAGGGSGVRASTSSGATSTPTVSQTARSSPSRPVPFTNPHNIPPFLFQRIRQSFNSV